MFGLAKVNGFALL